MAEEKDTRPFMPIYRIGHSVLRFILKTFYSLKIVGLEKVPVKGCCLLACNHQSLIDPPMLGISVTQRQVFFMAKRELLETPFIGWFLSGCGCFWVDRKARDGKSVAQGIERLDDGRLVGIFPEGTRSKDGKLKVGRSGVALMALKTGSPIVPCCVFNTLEVTKRHYLPGPKLSIRFGDPIYIEKVDEPDRELIHAVRDQVMEAIAKLQQLGSAHDEKPTSDENHTAEEKPAT